MVMRWLRGNGRVWDTDEAAGRGAAFLDERLPGWHWDISVASLDMAQGGETFDQPGERVRACGCIGLQLDILWAKAHEEEASRREFWWARSVRRYGLKPVTHGLVTPDNLPAHDTALAFGDLTRAWKKEIRRRRKRDQARTRRAAHAGA